MPALILREHFQYSTFLPQKEGAILDVFLLKQVH